MKTKRPTVLIVEPNPVIATDVADTVQDVLGPCGIMEVSSAETALAALREGAEISLAVLCLSPAAISSSGLDALLDARHVAVVVISDDMNGELAAGLWQGWGFVATPFTTFDLTEAILGAASDHRKCPEGTCAPVAG